VELVKRKNSHCWWYDFTVRGERFRGSTKETNKAAASAKAAQLLAEGQRPAINKKAPVLGGTCRQISGVCRQQQACGEVKGVSA